MEHGAGEIRCLTYGRPTPEGYPAVGAGAGLLAVGNRRSLGISGIALRCRAATVRYGQALRCLALRRGPLRPSANASGKFETGATLLRDLLIDTKELLRKVYFAIYKTPSEEA
jgi:hypothetical protein